MKNKSIDLHMHTTYSDGSCSPSQVAKDCGLNGVEVISITDHDSTAGILEARFEADKFGLKVITGAELSTKAYHILGYDFDLENRVIQDALSYSRHVQEMIVRLRVEKIQDMGVPLTIEKVKQYSPNARLGKGNIALAMVYDNECRKQIGVNKTLGEIMSTYMKHLDYDININELTPDEAIYSINKAGGIPVIAHPFKDVKRIEEIDELVRLGLRGVEIQPTYGKRNDKFLIAAK